MFCTSLLSAILSSEKMFLSGFLSVFLKDFMSACSLCEIQYIEKAGWTLCLIITKSTIRYCAVIEFLTLENVQPQQIRNTAE